MTKLVFMRSCAPFLFKDYHNQKILASERLQ